VQGAPTSSVSHYCQICKIASTMKWLSNSELSTADERTEKSARHYINNFSSAARSTDLVKFSGSYQTSPLDTTTEQPTCSTCAFLPRPGRANKKKFDKVEPSSYLSSSGLIS